MRAVLSDREDIDELVIDDDARIQFRDQYGDDILVDRLERPEPGLLVVVLLLPPQDSRA